MILSNSSPTLLLQGLNPEQLSAVTWPPQSALILAGAGSGKTRVLTTRIAWLLQSGQASVHSVMAVTFTNKAAKEMQNRLASMTSINVKAMWLGTFHGLCHRFLRLHHRDAGLPSEFQILDSTDQLALIKRLLKALNIVEEVVAPRTLQGFINAQKEAGLRPSSLHAPDSYTKRLIMCYEEYDKTCNKEGVVDFAELMLRSYEILQKNESLLLHYQNRFNHILVDEFQDTNKLQYAWLKLMAGGDTAIFAVGDDDQSIYRFRGAHVGNMIALMKEFGIDIPIKLEQNYRSVGNILKAANAVIANNDERLGKNLRTDAESGEKIRFLSAPSDFDEAVFIREEIKALQRDGWLLNQLAVLYRNNAQSRILEQELFRSGIPYKIYGGLRFYERQEVKHALAYLRLAVNPEDDNALLRVINVPARGIGTRTVENIQSQSLEQNISLWHAACNIGTKSVKVAAFVNLIETLRKQIGQISLADTITNVIHESGLVDYYKNQKGDNQDRLDNLNELVNAAAAFKPEENDFGILPEYGAAADPLFPVLSFLSNAALESGEGQAGEGNEAVQLMTVHAAKGLEFDAVFLTGMEEGRFPSELSLTERDGLEEERRLMYVAITRARKRLYISMAEQRMLHGKMQFGVVSRFLEEIPKDVLHNLLPIPTKYAYTAQPKPFREPGYRESVDTAQESYAGFVVGQNVRHAKFGTGVIIDAVNKGVSARLTINFGKEGIKELDTQFAHLTFV